MTITLTISPQQTQVECLAAQLGLSVPPNALVYSGPLGDVCVRGNFFPNGLSLHGYVSTTRQPLNFQTVNPADSGLYCLFINLSDEPLDKQIGETAVHLSQHAPTGIFYYAPNLYVTQQIAVGVRFTAVCITFSAQTLQQLPLDVRADELLPQLGGFVFLDLDRPTERLLCNLLEPADPGSLTELRHYGQTVEVLARILARMRDWQTRATTVGLLQPDIDKLFEARRLLLQNLTAPPTQPELARAIGLSEATLRRYFSRLFGQPMYQYVQAARMAQAHELLATRQFSVSEVGFRVGYTNLTHFANAYRKHFGQNPSDFLKTVTEH